MPGSPALQPSFKDSNVSTNWKDYLADSSYQIGMLPGLEVGLRAISREIESIQAVRAELPYVGAILPGLEMERDHILQQIAAIRTANLPRVAQETQSIGQRRTRRLPSVPVELPPAKKKRKQYRRSSVKLLAAAKVPETTDPNQMSQPHFVRYVAIQHGGSASNDEIKEEAKKFKRHESMLRNNNVSVIVATAINQKLVERVEKGRVKAL